MHRSMFSAADPLPKGSLTVSFKFRVFARRLSAGTSFGVKSGNLIAFGTTMDVDSLNLDFDNKGYHFPAPGGISSGWHQITVAFDSAMGVLHAYFDGRLGVNMTGVSQGKSLAGTLGPG